MASAISRGISSLAYSQQTPSLHAPALGVSTSKTPIRRRSPASIPSEPAHQLRHVVRYALSHARMAQCALHVSARRCVPGGAIALQSRLLRCCHRRRPRNPTRREHAQRRKRQSRFFLGRRRQMRAVCPAAARSSLTERMMGHYVCKQLGVNIYNITLNLTQCKLTHICIE